MKHLYFICNGSLVPLLLLTEVETHFLNCKRLLSMLFMEFSFLNPMSRLIDENWVCCKWLVSNLWLWKSEFWAYSLSSSKNNWNNSTKSKISLIPSSFFQLHWLCGAYLALWRSRGCWMSQGLRPFECLPSRCLSRLPVCFCHQGSYFASVSHFLPSKGPSLANREEDGV